MIILGIIEGVLGFVFTVGLMLLISMGFFWIFAKFFGTNFHSRFQAKDAILKHQEYEIEVKEYSQKKPTLFNEAISSCKQKGYSLTYFNILSEIRKIENRLNSEPKIIEKISEKISTISEKIKFNNSQTDIEKLERLNKLKIEGGISEDEYIEFKNKILHNDKTQEKKTQPIKSDEKIEKVKDEFDIHDEFDRQNALKTINSLYFEFKEEIDGPKVICVPAT